MFRSYNYLRAQVETFVAGVRLGKKFYDSVMAYGALPSKLDDNMKNLPYVFEAIEALKVAYTDMEQDSDWRVRRKHEERILEISNDLVEMVNSPRDVLVIEAEKLDD